MGIKLICTDVDGTLLNKQREVDNYTLKVVGKLDPEIRFVLASSRMPKALYHLQNTLNISRMPLICYNGALILTSGNGFDPQKIISSVTISAENINAIMNLANQHQVHISLYQNNTWLVSETDFYAQREINNTRVKPDGLLSGFSAEELQNFIQNGAHKIMLMGEPKLLDLIEANVRRNLKVAVWRSKDIYLEITPFTNKNEGLQVLLNSFPENAKVNLGEVMAFGDGYNDLEMVTNAGIGVAVGNAVPELKQAAFAVTKPNIEHGVACYLEGYFHQ
ncbi:HAD family hydrolase [Mucilaginibacter sp.]|uniref:HAD family hydrolase n=1 Tax=Mucilaginibacter sp. TaxID=1882438 RepID=UPI003B00D90C